jgi:hypothetical protein
LGCRKQRDEGRRGSSPLDIRSTASVFAFQETKRTNNFKFSTARGLNSLDGRSAGCANVIHNHNPSAFAPETLNTLASAVLFLSLAHQEGLDRRTAFRAHDCSRDCDWIGAERQAADSFRLPSACPDFIEYQVADQLCAAGVKRCGSAIDVVVAVATRRQLELAELERFLRQHGQQVRTSRTHCSFSR